MIELIKSMLVNNTPEQVYKIMISEHSLISNQYISSWTMFYILLAVFSLLFFIGSSIFCYCHAEENCGDPSPIIIPNVFSVFIFAVSLSWAIYCGNYGNIIILNKIQECQNERIYAQTILNGGTPRRPN